MGTAINTIINAIGVNQTPISSIVQYYDDKVLSVNVKGANIGPQVGDVMLNLDRVTISVFDFYEKFNDDGTAYNYVKGNICLKDGMLHRCISDVSVPGVWNYSEWEELDLVDILCPDFEPLYSYEKWQVVAYEGVIWRAKKDFTAGLEFNSTDWEPLSKTMILPFSPNREYAKEEAIYHIDETSGRRVLYVAKNHFISGNEFNKNDCVKIIPDDPRLVVSKFEVIGNTAKDKIAFKWTYRNNVTDEETSEQFELIMGFGMSYDPETGAVKFSVDNWNWSPENQEATPGLITSCNPKKTNLYYRGKGTANQMRSVANPRNGDIYDNTDTSTVWRYSGGTAGGATYTQANTTTPLGWQNTGQPFSDENEKVDNYTKLIADDSATSDPTTGTAPIPMTYMRYENRQLKYFGEKAIMNHVEPDILNLSQLWADTNLEYLNNVKHNGFANGEMMINNGTATAPQWVPFTDKYGQTFDAWRTSVENRIKDLQNRVGAIENAIYNWGNDKNTKIPRGNINIYSGQVGTTGIITRAPGNNTSDLRFN